MSIEDRRRERHTYRYWPTIIAVTLIPWIWVALVVIHGASGFFGLALGAVVVVGSAILSVRGARLRLITSADGIVLFNLLRTYRLHWADVAGFEVLRDFLYPHAVIRFVSGKRRTITFLIPFGFPYLSYFGDRFEEYVQELEQDRRRWAS
jgi:hypothetical protein